MNNPEVQNDSQDKRSRFPLWITPIYLTVLFLLVHVAAPWGLSLLGARYGWIDGLPGLWNLLALILVVAGIACTIWMIVLHYRASPRPFLEMRSTQKLVTPGPYSFSRNPMYLFELSFWFGWTIFYGSIAVLFGFLFWLVMFNFFIVPWEERDLEARFGDTYRQYKKKIPRWLGVNRR